MRRLLLLLLLAACKHQSDLPKLFPLPNAKLMTEAGKPLQLDALKGNVVVYDFIFTNCAGTCPMMTAAMRRVTAKVDKNGIVREYVSSLEDDAVDHVARTVDDLTRE